MGAGNGRRSVFGGGGEAGDGEYTTVGTLRLVSDTASDSSDSPDSSSPSESGSDGTSSSSLSQIASIAFEADPPPCRDALEGVGTSKSLSSKRFPLPVKKTGLGLSTARGGNSSVERAAALARPSNLSCSALSAADLDVRFGAGLLAASDSFFLSFFFEGVGSSLANIWTTSASDSLWCVGVAWYRAAAFSKPIEGSATPRKASISLMQAADTCANDLTAAASKIVCKGAQGL